MVTFRQGTTRYVFCIGNIAVKVARVRPFHAIKRFFYWRKNGGAGTRLASLHTSKLIAVLRHLSWGVIGNLEERSFYLSHKDLDIAPTYFTFFGLFNIQARGKEISQRELPLCPFQEHAHEEYDLRRHEHFGRVRNKICLLDYGTARVNDLILGVTYLADDFALAHKNA